MAAEDISSDCGELGKIDERTFDGLVGALKAYTLCRTRAQGELLRSLQKTGPSPVADPILQIEHGLKTTKVEGHLAELNALSDLIVILETPPTAPGLR